MRTLVTLVLILLSGNVAVAQKTDPHAKVESHKVDIVLDHRPAVLVTGEQDKRTKEIILARVYPYRNYRVMKALHFLTIRSLPKLT